MVGISVKTGPERRTAGSEAAPFRTGQTHASPAQLRLQHQVLGSEVLDHLQATAARVSRVALITITAIWLPVTARPFGRWFD